MEKYGVQKEIQHEDLRNEEAKLMRTLQQCFTRPFEKQAQDRSRIESELAALRAKITELDTAN